MPSIQDEFFILLLPAFPKLMNGFHTYWAWKVWAVGRKLKGKWQTEQTTRFDKLIYSGSWAKYVSQYKIMFLLPNEDPFLRTQAEKADFFITFYRHSSEANVGVHLYRQRKWDHSLSRRGSVWLQPHCTQSGPVSFLAWIYTNFCLPQIPAEMASVRQPVGGVSCDPVDKNSG